MPGKSKAKVTFHWKGINSQGYFLSGKVSSHSKSGAEKTLQQKDITPIKIKRQLTLPFVSTKINQKQLAEFAQKLGSLLITGIPLEKAILLLAHENKLEQWNTIYSNLLLGIQGGAPFSRALEKSSSLFNQTFCALIMASEQSGTLAETLLDLSGHIDSMSTVKEKIKKAAVYPVTILLFSIVVSAGLLIFIVPQFQDMFANFNAKLPTLTLAVIQLSSLLQSYGLILLVGILSILKFIHILYLKNNKIHNTIDRAKLYTPFFGSLFTTSALTLWLKIMSATYSKGVPLLDALTLANTGMTNVYISHKLKRLIPLICSGSALHIALEATGLFTETSCQLVSIGESAGTLPEVIKNLSEAYQADLLTKLDGLSKIAEPFIILLLAVITGTLVIAMYLPIFKMGSIL